MFLGKLFRKDYRSYLEQGEKCLAEERYADARLAFQEALQRLPKAGDDVAAQQSIVRERLTLAGNKLGLLNLTEAEHALNRGDVARASDHLALVRELAEDVTIREKAEKLLQSREDESPSADHGHGAHGCAGCAPSAEKTPTNLHANDSLLPAGDRFDILVQPLPGDLPRRYAELGEKFACAFLLHHDGNDEESLRIYEELLAREENDILLYETALIHYHRDNIPECERLLRRAIELTPSNPLCHLSLVQLFIDSERFDEALQTLTYMIAQKLLLEQSLLTAGDLLQHLGEDARAVEMFSQALVLPGAARAAAERLIPLLEQQGRSAEAQYLFKTYCKGCC